MKLSNQKWFGLEIFLNYLVILDIMEKLAKVIKM